MFILVTKSTSCSLELCFDMATAAKIGEPGHEGTDLGTGAAEDNSDQTKGIIVPAPAAAGDDPRVSAMTDAGPSEGMAGRPTQAEGRDNFSGPASGGSATPDLEVAFRNPDVTVTTPPVAAMRGLEMQQGGGGILAAEQDRQRELELEQAKIQLIALALEAQRAELAAQATTQLILKARAVAAQEKMEVELKRMQIETEAMRAEAEVARAGVEARAMAARSALEQQRARTGGAAATSISSTAMGGSAATTDRAAAGSSGTGSSAHDGRDGGSGRPQDSASAVSWRSEKITPRNAFAYTLKQLDFLLVGTFVAAFQQWAESSDGAGSAATSNTFMRNTLANAVQVEGVDLRAMTTVPGATWMQDLACLSGLVRPPSTAEREAMVAKLKQGELPLQVYAQSLYAKLELLFPSRLSDDGFLLDHLVAGLKNRSALEKGLRRELAHKRLGVETEPRVHWAAMVEWVTCEEVALRGKAVAAAVAAVGLADGSKATTLASTQRSVPAADQQPTMQDIYTLVSNLGSGGFNSGGHSNGDRGGYYRGGQRLPSDTRAFRDGSGNGRNGKPVSPAACWWCNEEGHIQSRCARKQAERARADAGGPRAAGATPPAAATGGTAASGTAPPAPSAGQPLNGQ